MSESPSVLERFLDEVTLLISAIDQGVTDAEYAGDVVERRARYAETCRVSDALARLAEAFEAADIAALAQAVATATSRAAEVSDTSPIPIIGAHDATIYLRRRLADMRRAGAVAQGGQQAADAVGRLIEALSLAGSLSQPAAASDGEGYDQLSDLDPEERDLFLTFDSVELGARNADQDTAALRAARVAIGSEGEPTSGAPPSAVADDIDIIPLEMKRLFLAETETDLQELSQHIAAFVGGRGTQSSLPAMAGIAHKIKGSAATVGFPDFSRVAVFFERLVLALQSEGAVPRDRMSATLGRFIELFDACVVAAENLNSPDPAIVSEAQRLFELATSKDDGAMSADAVALMASARSRRSPRSSVALGIDPAASGMKVDAGRLEDLWIHVGALAINRGALANAHARVTQASHELESALERLQHKSALIVDGTTDPGRNRWGIGGSRGGAAPPGDAPRYTDSSPGIDLLRDAWQAADFEQVTDRDSALVALSEVVADLETHGAALSTALMKMAQLIETQEASIAHIQQDATRLRLAPLKDLAPRLEVLVNWLAPAVGKQVTFSIAGEMTEIDRRLLRGLTEPLNQLVRNAVVHGIESPEDRTAAGKPMTGSVWVRAYYVASDVVIEVGDDGRGVDEQALTGFSTGGEALESAVRENVRDLHRIFDHGVTSMRRAGALAGSGIGLSEVETRVREVKGEIEIAETSAQGTVFRIRAPMTLTAVQSVALEIGGQTFAAPLGAIMATFDHVDAQPRMPPSRPAETSEDARLLTEYVLNSPESPLRNSDTGGDDLASNDQEGIPAYSLAERLGISVPETPTAAIVVARGKNRIGLLVDRVGPISETMVRPLPPFLRRRLIRGVTIRAEDGAIALLLDVATIADQLLAGIVSAPPLAPAQPQRKVHAAPVLIVDDSITIRRAVDQALRQAGFTTALARDGIEALEFMGAELPRVIVLDLEMPRLGGIELLRAMRDEPRYTGVRVAVLTSEAGSTREQQARELGADAYLLKPCSQDKLVAVVRRLYANSEYS
ncbi:MAG TPA: response regulator [Ktedonobacterales bacterium]